MGYKRKRKRKRVWLTCPPLLHVPQTAAKLSRKIWRSQKIVDAFSSVTIATEENLSVSSFSPSNPCGTDSWREKSSRKLVRTITGGSRPARSQEKRILVSDLEVLGIPRTDYCQTLLLLFFQSPLLLSYMRAVYLLLLLLLFDYSLAHFYISLLFATGIVCMALRFCFFIGWSTLAGYTRGGHEPVKTVSSSEINATLFYSRQDI